MISIRKRDLDNIIRESVDNVFLDDPSKKDEIEADIKDDEWEWGKDWTKKDVENDYSWYLHDNRPKKPSFDTYMQHILGPGNEREKEYQIDNAIWKRDKDNDWSEEELRKGYSDMQDWVHNNKPLHVTESRLNSIVMEAINNIINEIQIGGQSLHGNNPVDWEAISTVRFNNADKIRGKRWRDGDEVDYYQSCYDERDNNWAGIDDHINFLKTSNSPRYKLRKQGERKGNNIFKNLNKAVKIGESELTNAIKSAINEAFNKRSIIHKLYRITAPYTIHKYRDTGWQGVNEILEALRGAGFDVTCSCQRGGYELPLS